ncbi:hypothetical protein BJV82DRAFT_667657 [Fennellomyces sp. T-0311]|nr:hypothetical protein BJV82DRAFT_667657 [Fennellomyces sp. T-0311]
MSSPLSDEQSVRSYTSHSKSKLQWLALLLPAVAALCIYICLRVRHARKRTKQQNNADEWFIPSSTRHHDGYHQPRRHRGLPLIRFSDPIQCPLPAHHGPWRRRHHMHPHDRNVNDRRHRHHRRRRRRRPRTPPPAYPGTTSPPPPQYEEVTRVSDDEPLVHIHRIFHRDDASAA